MRNVSVPAHANHTVWQGVYPMMRSSHGTTPSADKTGHHTRVGGDDFLNDYVQ